jgi:hypothetical protein
VPVLADILLELAQNGVQIFVTSHDYRVVRYFDVRKNKNIPVIFHNLSKTEDRMIVCYSSPMYLKLEKNILEDTVANIFEAVIQDARRNFAGDDDNE